MVLWVVDPCDHPWDGELLLGEERHDQVVLVVPRGRDHDICRRQAGQVERRHLAGVPHYPLEAQARAPGRHVGVDLDHQDVVASLLQVEGEVRADVTATRYDDFHRGPLSSRCSNVASAGASTDTY